MAAGPAVRLDATTRDGESAASGSSLEDNMQSAGRTSPGTGRTSPGPALRISGAAELPSRPGFAKSVRIVGRTDANFSFDFETLDGTTRPAKGCPTCGADACMRATGTLVVKMTTNPVVTLPTINPNLTPCQARRVQTAIDTQIAPHEQQHVDAFRTYEGERRRPFDVKFCDQADFDARIQSIVNSIEGPRRSRAQAASDLLDTPPFEINVDIDCTEPAPPPTTPGKGAPAPSGKPK
jgi:hypothetical protein